MKRILNFNTFGEIKFSSMRIFFLAVFVLVSTENSFGQSITEKIDSIVHSRDSLSPFNGVIIFANDVDDVTTLKYGYTDPLTKKQKISSNDRFDLASLTKQFTGLAVLQLIRDGHLHAEDTIGGFVPGLKPAPGAVTIRQLANHTNGIHDFYSMLPEKDFNDHQKILDTLCSLDSTVFTPGTKWGYSNSGYFLLGEIISSVSKTTYTDYCEKQILRKLKMSGARFAPCKKVLRGYTKELKPVAFISTSYGDGGLYANANDMVAYFKSVCQNPDLWNPLFDLAESLSDKSNTENWNYGFGWYFSQDTLGKFRAHSGKNPGADTYIRWYPDRQIFLCILSNKSDPGHKALREEIMTAIVGTLEK